MSGPTKVVWDFGGVLFQWRPPELLRRHLPQRVTDEASAAHWVDQIFQGYEGDWQHFDRGTVEPDALVRRIVARTGLAEAEVRAIVDGVPDELQPIEDSVALVSRLHAAGVTQFYLSNMPAPYADHLEERHGFIALFAAGVFSARVQAVKPERDIFDLAVQRFGVPPGELLFFDDSRANVAAARAHGWHAEVFTTAATAEEALRGYGFIR